MFEFAEVAILAAKVLATAVALTGAAIGPSASINRYKVERKRKTLLSNELSSRFIKQFNEKELSRALLGYITPHCAQTDPVNKEEEYLADLRESIFEYMDRYTANSAKSHQLLLADTGMGKTSFCLNYVAHVRRKFPKYNVALVSLAGKGFARSSFLRHKPAR
jgi:hypothetical protein